MATQSAPVLVTRPKAEAEAFAAALTSRLGDRVRPVVAPLLSPRFLDPSIPDQHYAAVIFTSAQAVEAARHLDLRLPSLAWCVGRKTAAVAAAAGFKARSADGDADALAKAILRDPPDGRLLYLRGVDTRGNLLESLRSSGVFTDVGIVYVQDPQPLSDAALSILASPVDLVVPLFSPRTAALFRMTLPDEAHARLHLVAMSAAVAEALAGVPHASLSIATTPDTPAMLDSIETLLARLPPP
jgi:uroporphyrinogen-III synthase